MEPTLGPSLEIKRIWLQNLSNSEGGLERLTSTTAKSYCTAGMSHMAPHTIHRINP